MLVSRSGGLSKKATHPLCPLLPHDHGKPIGSLLIIKLPHEVTVCWAAVGKAIYESVERELLLPSKAYRLLRSILGSIA